MSELPNTPLLPAAATSIPAEAPWTWKDTIPGDAELRKLGGDVVADEPCHLGHAESLLWKRGLGERIVALQKLVSPFGKTDTACILYEALDYIGFLHGQVQALSSPYLQCPPPPALRVPLPTAVEPSDLRSRGLCLVPVSCSDRVAAVDVCSLVAAMRLTAGEEEEDTEAAVAMLRLRGDHHPGETV
ncbi:hypothetical protein D1007_42504 [Hordeum vulgare]|nr:hypothetical protein D1007_42504 [Hordeum vulgare]KAI4984994.1 hypothetical protein ZWY2020_017624 [Hordeum vulgare]